MRKEANKQDKEINFIIDKKLDNTYSVRHQLKCFYNLD